MIAWVAFVLALLELVLLVVVAGGAIVTYRKVKPTVSPFLSMLAPYTGAPDSSSSSAATSPSPPAEPSSSTPS